MDSGWNWSSPKQVKEAFALAGVALERTDEQSLAAFGRNLLDPAKRAVAAEAGLRQSRDLVDVAGPVWAA